ncbi:MAG: 2Fe-2S iron-sulfur cluster-binding protein [Nitriliruptoraceae bacterium]
MSPRPANARPTVPVTIDGESYKAFEGETVMELARRVGVRIPSLCYLEGLSIHGGCRLCVVEVEGDHRLFPACAMEVTAELSVTTQSWDLHEHRRRMTELLFAEGSHVCAFCVSSGSCELQDLATEHDVDHIHYDFAHPSQGIDASHPKYSLDRDRCVLCTRCVRVCDEIEGAHVWDVAMRGSQGRIVAGMDQPWGEVPDCTWCGKCVLVCPTGALSFKGRATAEMVHDPDVVAFLATAREDGEWLERKADA